MSGRENYIYYLRTKGGLPPYYFQLSQILKDFQTTLVPVTLEQLMEMPLHQTQVVLAVSPDMESFQYFQYAQKRFMEFALKTKRLTLVHASSFSTFPRAEQLYVLRNYHHLTIPVSLYAIAHKAFVLSQIGKSIDQKWPGGRRAKLPPMNGSK